MRLRKPSRHRLMRLAAAAALLLAAAGTRLSAQDDQYSGGGLDGDDSSDYHLKRFEWVTGGSESSGRCWNYRCHGGGDCCYIS